MGNLCKIQAQKLFFQILHLPLKILMRMKNTTAVDVIGSSEPTYNIHTNMDYLFLNFISFFKWEVYPPQLSNK